MIVFEQSGSTVGRERRTLTNGTDRFAGRVIFASLLFGLTQSTLAYGQIQDGLPRKEDISFFAILWGEVFHSAIAIAAFVVLSAINFIFGSVAYRIPRLRLWSKKYGDLERYSGTYVQVIYEPTDETAGVGAMPSITAATSPRFRYSLVEIYYRARDQKYVLEGHQYESSGRRTTVFTSELVGIHDDIVTSLEFVWRTEELTPFADHIHGRATRGRHQSKPDSSTESGDGKSSVRDPRNFHGFTRMTFNDPDDDAELEGRGFFKSFASETKLYDFYFFRVSAGWLSRLHQPEHSKILVTPKNERERREFIVSLHTALICAENRHISIIPGDGEAFI